MGAPPIDRASAGRVNPEGISYLYLGADVDTTLYEIRAGLYDFVTVGSFMLMEDIRVVDLTAIENVSVFSGWDKTKYAVNKRHIEKFGEDIAKPMRRSDSILDYLPTQYICEYIKSIKDLGNYSFQGIKYKSTMKEDGFNLVVFNEKLLKCTKTWVYDITDILLRLPPEILTCQTFGQLIVLPVVHNLPLQKPIFLLF